MPGWLRQLLAMGALVMMSTAAGARDNDFASDVDFLKKHVDVIVLETDEGGPRVAVVPAYQGRVMTSTAGGANGASYGWINYEHIEAGKLTPHINVFGGEERFWIGPEGGQFSIFFPPGAKFELADWQTPTVIDTDAFEVVDRKDDSVHFRHDARLKNHSGTEFFLGIDRKIELLSRADA